MNLTENDHNHSHFRFKKNLLGFPVWFPGLKQNQCSPCLSYMFLSHITARTRINSLLTLRIEEKHWQKKTIFSKIVQMQTELKVLSTLPRLWFLSTPINRGRMYRGVSGTFQPRLHRPTDIGDRSPTIVWEHWRHLQNVERDPLRFPHNMLGMTFMLSKVNTQSTYYIWTCSAPFPIILSLDRLLLLTNWGQVIYLFIENRNVCQYYFICFGHPINHDFLSHPSTGDDGTLFGTGTHVSNTCRPTLCVSPSSLPRLLWQAGWQEVAGGIWPYSMVVTYQCKYQYQNK